VEPILETAEGFSFLLFLFNATQKEKNISYFKIYCNYYEANLKVEKEANFKVNK
jgi:hypothetical protein